MLTFQQGEPGSGPVGIMAGRIEPGYKKSPPGQLDQAGICEPIRGYYSIE